MGGLAPRALLLVLLLATIGWSGSVEGCFEKHRYADEFVGRVEKVQLEGSEYYILETLKRGGKDLLVCDETGEVPAPAVVEKILFYYLLLQSDTEELAKAFQSLAKYAKHAREKGLREVSADAQRVAELLQDFGERPNGNIAAECYEKLKGLRERLEGLGLEGLEGFVANIRVYEESIKSLEEQLELRLKSKKKARDLRLVTTLASGVVLSLLGAVLLLRRIRWR